MAVIGRWDGEPAAPARGCRPGRREPRGRRTRPRRGASQPPGRLGRGGAPRRRLPGRGIADLLSGPASVVSHDFKELLRSVLPRGSTPTSLAMDTAVAAYLLDPSSGRYGLAAVAAGEHLGQRAPEHAPGPTQLVLDSPEGGGGPAGGDEDRALAAAVDAATVDLLVPRLRRDLDREGLSTLHDEIECPLVRVLARMEVAGIRVDGEELAGSPTSWPTRPTRSRSRSTRSPGRVQRQLDAPAANSSLRGARADPAAQDQDRILDRCLHLGAPPRRAPDRRHAAAVPGGGEAPLHLRRPASWPRWPRTVGSTPRSARPSPGPAGCPRSGPTCTTSRCAPRAVGGSVGPSSPPTVAPCW